jgi:GAF domain-containing protein
MLPAGSPFVEGLLVLMGAVACLAIGHLALWVGRRADRLSFWVTAWCTLTFVYINGHFVQAAATTTAQALVGARACWTSAFLLVPVVIGLAHAFVDRPAPRPALWVTGLFGAALVGLVWFTQAIIEPQTYLRRDWVWGTYLAVMPGPLQRLMLPYSLSVFVYGIVLVWRARNLVKWEQRLFLGAFAFYCVVSINDVLHASRVITGGRLFDFGFAGVAVGLTYFQIRRHNYLVGRLEEQVAERTSALRARGDQLVTLADLTQSLTSTLALDQVLQRFVRHAVALFGDGLARLWLLDEDGQTLRLRAHAGATSETVGITRLTLGEGLMGTIAATRQPLVIDDVSEDSRTRNLARVRAEGTVSFAGVPLLLGERTLGAFGIAVRERRRFSAEDVRLLELLAGHAAIAIENARLYRTLEERLTRQQTLTRLTRLISGSLDTPTVLAEISRAAGRLMESPLALFWVADRQRGTLQFAEPSDPELAADFPLREVRFDEGIVGWIATHREPVMVADVFPDSRFRAHEWWRRHGLTSFYGLPVMLDGALLAVLTFNSRRPFDMTPVNQDFLESFVAQAALALRNASLFEAEAAARRDVEHALAQVKQLHGLLPICAYCKKIRNDRNYWEAIESYIGERSAATFSHGICPECRERVVGPELERWKQGRRGP